MKEETADDKYEVRREGSQICSHLTAAAGGVRPDSYTHRAAEYISDEEDEEEGEDAGESSCCFKDASSCLSSQLLCRRRERETRGTGGKRMEMGM